MQNATTERSETRVDPAPCSVRAIRRGERTRLLRWLDGGLRGGRDGRLEAEYGPVLEESELTHHAVATCGDRLVAHAMARRVSIRAAGVTARIGMVGLVFTEPAFRRRGLAARCIRACEAWLAGQGVALAVLWSDRHELYARLGYHLAGIEETHRIDRPACERARRGLPFAGEVGEAETEDWGRLEALYRARTSRAERAEGYLPLLATGPDCRVLVARRDARPIAYAAFGRGDDFPDVVHEWAGDPAGIVACLARLLENRESIAWMTGPGDEAPAPALRAAGAFCRRGGFGLVRLMEPGALWAGLTADDPALRETRLTRGRRGFRLVAGGGTFDLDARTAGQLLLDPGVLEAVRPAFSERQLAALSTRLPWPLFVWGFDSV